MSRTGPLGLKKGLYMYTGDLSYSNYNQATVTWHRIPERARLPHSLDLNGGLGFRVQRVPLWGLDIKNRTCFGLFGTPGFYGFQPDVHRASLIKQHIPKPYPVPPPPYRFVRIEKIQVCRCLLHFFGGFVVDRVRFRGLGQP